jgi:hypothetical protein
MINIIRRDDTTITTTCKDSSGNPIDITGYSVFFTVKSEPNQPDSDALISKKVTSHSNPTQGITHITLTHDDTNIDEGDYIYDFQLVTPGGAVSSSQRDTITVTNDITIRTT